MKFTRRSRPMFQVALDSGPNDALRLLDFMRFVIESRAADEIADHPLYAPSGMWKDLCAETFVGFSTSKLIIQSGHRFPEATDALPKDRSPSLRDALVRKPGPLTFDTLRRKFGPYEIPDAEETIARHKPLQYFLAAELDRLATLVTPFRTMLEVGAGAGVNVALLCLRPGGRFLSENQATARHIPGNDISRYNLAGMTETQRRTPPFAQSLVLNGLDVVMLEFHVPSPADSGLGTEAP